MKKIIYAVAFLIAFNSCQTKKEGSEKAQNGMQADSSFANVLQKYYDERMQLFPLEATVNGDTLHNDILPADFTESYHAKLKDFFIKYNDALAKTDTTSLNNNDHKSYNILKYEIDMAQRGLALGYSGSSAMYMPFDQFNGTTLMLGQMGSGTGNQPFKTVKDYDNWLKRATAFSGWADSAIVYFKKGIANKTVLPKSIVVKMIPQMQNMVTAEPTKSLFYGPITLMPAAFAEVDKQRLTAAYINLIKNEIVPAYKKLGDFLQNEYLSKARTTTGINALPNGAEVYNYFVKYWTTTNKKSDEIYNTGLAEVKRIRDVMEQIKTQTGFKGNLDSFFTFMNNDKQFMPYKNPEEVLAAFRKIQTTIDPNLKKIFSLTPKTTFQIRQTEAFRAASASAEYYPGLPDGSRPGIFYIPIIDATKFNTTSGMESLFLHEAIPGHHYQMSIQSENKTLPAFRRFLWYGAYGEGYALYCESLGKELGLYTDPYQYMGALGDEIHRAIRLVVDVAMHTGKMTREQAITYMMQNEAISQEGATAEIERYMVYPAQALSYKTGALKIKELREKYTQKLGSKFSLAAFHDEFLKDGCMPLEIIEKSMDEWAKKQ